MATVTHVIRSHYDPADRERLERETGQGIDDPSNDSWEAESSSPARHRIRGAPTFVPASTTYDEWGIPSHTSSLHAEASEKPSNPPSTSSAEWYRSLRQAVASSSSSLTDGASPPPRPPRPPSPRFQETELKPSKERVTKNDWFIHKVLRSEPSTKPSSPAPSLADLLVRDPPPLPSEGRYIPPVWLHIGPSNRGFGMLQRSGWKEGEGLGAHVSHAVLRDADERTSSDLRTREVIDLTLSDSEAPEVVLRGNDVISSSMMRTQATTSQASTSHMQRSLLTPLPIVLKADRLGIGLNAKTEGPYRRSKKRVTHGAAALAAHIRSAEEIRKKKVAFGRGRRGFVKLHKREEDRRRAMLTYFNE